MDWSGSKWTKLDWSWPNCYVDMAQKECSNKWYALTFRYYKYLLELYAVKFVLTTILLKHNKEFVYYAVDVKQTNHISL